MDKTAPWKDYKVWFNVTVPVSVVLNPHSNTFRYETEITSPDDKKITIGIRLYCDSSKWAMQETLVDEDGTISETGEGITYMKIGEITNQFKENYL